MRGQAGFFDIGERLRELSAKGDELERLNAFVDFELFRSDLERAVPRSKASKADGHGMRVIGQSPILWRGRTP
jgi:hypothetical protein